MSLEVATNQKPRGSTLAWKSNPLSSRTAPEVVGEIVIVQESEPEGTPIKPQHMASSSLSASPTSERRSSLFESLEGKEKSSETEPRKEEPIPSPSKVEESSQTDTPHTESGEMATAPAKTKYSFITRRLTNTRNSDPHATPSSSSVPTRRSSLPFRTTSATSSAVTIPTSGDGATRGSKTKQRLSSSLPLFSFIDATAEATKQGPTETSSAPSSPAGSAAPTTIAERERRASATGEKEDFDLPQGWKVLQRPVQKLNDDPVKKPISLIKGWKILKRPQKEVDVNNGKIALTDGWKVLQPGVVTIQDERGSVALTSGWKVLKPETSEISDEKGKVTVTSGWKVLQKDKVDIETQNYTVKGEKNGWKVLTPKAVVVEDAKGGTFELPSGWRVLRHQDELNLEDSTEAERKKRENSKNSHSSQNSHTQSSGSLESPKKEKSKDKDRDKDSDKSDKEKEKFGGVFSKLTRRKTSSSKK